jgi:hypothetical protein
MKAKVVLTAMLTAALIVGAGVGAEARGAGGNSAAAKACQKGGFADWVRADGTEFADQGACVSYAARGGVLTEPELECFRGNWGSWHVIGDELAIDGAFPGFAEITWFPGKVECNGNPDPRPTYIVFGTASDLVSGAQREIGNILGCSPGATSVPEGSSTIIAVDFCLMA